MKADERFHEGIPLSVSDMAWFWVSVVTGLSVIAAVLLVIYDPSL